MRNFIHFYGNGFLGANPLIRTNKNGKEFAVVCLAINHQSVEVPTDWLWVTTSSNLAFIKTLRVGDHLSFFGRIKGRSSREGNKLNLFVEVMARIEHPKSEEDDFEMEDKVDEPMPSIKEKIKFSQEELIGIPDDYIDHI